MSSTSWILASLAICCAAWGRQMPPGEAVIRVDAGQRAQYVIPRTIFGTFHEPIGHSNYGGLWAQVLANPSFEENLWSVQAIERMVQEEPDLAGASRMGLPLPWQPLHPEQGWRYEPRWREAANSFRSLLIMALPEAETGVRQAVYLPVHRTRRYEGYVYVKPVSGPVTVELSLRGRNRPEQVYAKAAREATGRDWSKQQFSLELPAERPAVNEAVDFVIALRNDARALIDQALLYPADHIDGLDPEMVELARALKTPLVRFGGNFTSGYHWRDGVGPLDERISMLNQAWGIPEYNHFGTDELLRLCELIGAEPQIALNLGSGTPEEAAEWVSYVNSKWGKRRGGLLWELGNELWGSWQIGYPTLNQVAARTLAFSQTVRRVDPEARLIATGQDPDRFEEWNAAQLGIAPEAYSYLATHFVVGDAVVKQNPPAEFRVQAQLALPVGLERRLRQMKEQIDHHPRARGKVKLAFTEWLFHGDGRRVPNFHNMGGALCAAGFLNTLMRVADFTPIANMTGLIEFGGIWKKRSRVYAVPAYWAFRMYSTSDIHVPVETRTEVESYDVREGNRRIPEILGVPYLDVVAALNEAGDRLTLFCVNRRTAGPITAEIRVANFDPAAAAVAELRAAGLFSENNEWRPEAIRPREDRLEIPGGRFRYIFPPASVTVLRLERR